LAGRTPDGIVHSTMVLISSSIPAAGALSKMCLQRQELFATDSSSIVRVTVDVNVSPATTASCHRCLHALPPNKFLLQEEQVIAADLWNSSRREVILASSRDSGLFDHYCFINLACWTLKLRGREGEERGGHEIYNGPIRRRETLGS